MKEFTKEKLAEMLDREENIRYSATECVLDNNLAIIVATYDGGVIMYDDGVNVWGETDCGIISDDMDLALLLKGEKFTDEDSACRYVADRNMILPLSDEYNNDEHPRLIRVKREQDGTTPMWCVTSNIPHATFTLYEEGEPYSMGIVIDLDEVVGIK